MNWDSANIFLYFAINLFDLGVILRYFNRLLDSAQQKKPVLYSMYFLFLLFFTLLIRYEVKYTNIVSIALWSCIFLPTYKGEKRNKFVYAVLLLACAGFSQMTMYIISQINIHAIYTYFIPHIIFFIIVETNIKYQTVKGKFIEPKLLLLLISVPLISLIAMPCMVLLSERTQEISMQEEMTMLIPIALLILYMNIIVFYLYDTLSSAFTVKIQKEEYEQQLKWQQIYYDSLAENQDIVRKLKHDMQNNLQVLSRLITQENMAVTDNYLNELLLEQAQVNSIITTGNDAIDTVLNIKLSLAEQYDIKVNLNINIPSGLPITYQHSIRLFGNLLDNAIYALKDQTEIEKKIYCFMFFNANALVVQVSNQYRESPMKCDKDNFLHGLGLGIVKDTTELYDGTFEVLDDGEKFTVNIILYLKL